MSQIFPDIPSHWVISSTVFTCAGVYMVLCCTTFFKHKMGLQFHLFWNLSVEDEGTVSL